MANISLRRFAEALSDADLAGRACPHNHKSSYRKAQALAGLGKHEEALTELGALRETVDWTPSVAEYYEKIKAEWKMREWESTIVEECNPSFKSTDMEWEEGYTGPRLEMDQAITLRWIQSLLKYMSDGGKVPKKLVFILLERARTIFSAEPNVNEILLDGIEEVTVIGDIHGQFYDLVTLLEVISKYGST